MTKLFAKLKEEFLAVLPPTIFFFVALHIIAFVRVLMLKGTNVPVSSTMAIIVAALILGKAVLIADMLPFINRYPEEPLIYNVALEDCDLPGDRRSDSLPGTTARFLAPGRRDRCRQ